MENEQIPTTQPSELPSINSTTHRFFSKRVVVVLILFIIILAGFGGYVLGETSQNSNTQNLIPSQFPTQAVNTSPQITTPVALPDNCTADNQCPSGYACQALEGHGIDCSSGVSTKNPDGTANIVRPSSCTPSITIMKGVCKVQKGGTCTSDTDCLAGLICHAVSQGTTVIHQCADPTLGTCSGASDTSCPAGYVCTKGCGPPIIREGDNTAIPWNCSAKEIAGKPRACPICLASNTVIATPKGEVNVKNIKVGIIVWSVNRKGERIPSKVMKIGSTVVQSTHHVVHLSLSDGRELWASPNHPTVTGRPVGSLIVGEEYDNTQIIHSDLVQYWDTKTYDLLPNSDTGFYYANDILMDSTLH